MYHAELNQLKQEADELSKEKIQLSQSISGNLTQISEAEELLRFLARNEPISKYKGDLFSEYVETVTVHDRETFTFNFRCGLSLTERGILP